MGTSYKHVKGEVIWCYDGWEFLNFKPIRSKPIIDRTAHSHDKFNLGRFGENSIIILGNKFENPELLNI